LYTVHRQRGLNRWTLLGEVRFGVDALVLACAIGNVSTVVRIDNGDGGSLTRTVAKWRWQLGADRPGSRALIGG
jgi:hypothetical protein